MTKKAFTTRLDEKILAMAQQIAESERRSVTSVIEVAVLAYAEVKGLNPPKPADELLQKDTGTVMRKSKN